MNWYVQVLKKYAVFEGRARRREYWMFMLVNVVVFLGLYFLSEFAGGIAGGIGTLLRYLYSVAVFLPSLAVIARRLHDTGRSESWILLGLIPLIGTIILLIYLVQDSQPDENKHGPNPKAVAA